MLVSDDQHSSHQVQPSVAQKVKPAFNPHGGKVQNVSSYTGTDKCVWANHLNLIKVSLWQATENQSQMKRMYEVLRALIHRDVTRIIVQKAGKNWLKTWFEAVYLQKKKKLNRKENDHPQSLYYWHTIVTGVQDNFLSTDKHVCSQILCRMDILSCFAKRPNFDSVLLGVRMVVLFCLHTVVS